MYAVGALLERPRERGAMYAFNRRQLARVLYETVELFQEYRDQHGQDESKAILSAVQDAIEGLDAEQELYKAGEIKQPCQLL